MSMLLAGYLARRFERMPKEAADVLNRFVIDVCVPATILRLVPRLTFSSALAVLVAMPWAIAALALLVAALAQRALRLDRATTTALFLATALGNTSFLGFPLCGALLGEQAIPLAAVYDQLGSFMLLSTVAPIALSRVSASERVTFAAMLRHVLLFPPMLALLIALVPFQHAPWFESLLMAASAPLVPLAMFAVGLKLRLVPPRPARVLTLGLLLKLLVFPGVSWLLARGLAAPRLVLNVAVLETAMPTMITAGALMMAYGVASELAAAFVSWGLVLSLLTVPAWAALMR